MRQRAHPGQRLGDEIAAFGNHVIHQTPRQCFRSVEPPAEANHLRRATFSHQPRETLSPSCARNDAERGFGQAQFGGRYGDPQIAHHGKFESTAKRDTVDRRNHRLRAAIQHAELTPVKPNLHSNVVERHALAFLEVRTSAEGSLACTRQNDGAHTRIGDQFGTEPAQGIKGGPRQRVEASLPIDRQNPHAVTSLDPNRRLFDVHMPEVTQILRLCSRS